MPMIICFHHNDADGRASGAIVRYALGQEVLLVESDYVGGVIPWNMVEHAQKVIVVDFSFPLPEMQRLAEGRELIWIDHHKSAIAEMGAAAGAWPGIRDLSEAACVLTWKFFFPNKPVPQAVVLIGDRDIWRWAEADTGAFNEGLYMLNTQADNDSLWIPLLENDRQTLTTIISEGRRLREARLKNIERMVQHYGFEVGFEGHRTLAINTRGNGDLGQRGRDLGYEIVYCYSDQMQDGKLYTSVTLFSDQVDVSVIASKYGGGGHAGAAGFSFLRQGTPFPEESVVTWLPPDGQEKH